MTKKIEIVLTTLFTLLVVWWVMILLRRAFTTTLVFSYHRSPNSNDNVNVYPLFDPQKTPRGHVYVHSIVFPGASKFADDDLVFVLSDGVIRTHLFHSNKPSTHTLNMTDGAGAYLNKSGTIDLAIHADGRTDVQIHLVPRLFFSHGL